jgi:hypothetical protein
MKEEMQMQSKKKGRKESRKKCREMRERGNLRGNSKFGVPVRASFFAGEKAER